MDNNTSVEIPSYFICPISLHIMKDPVTTVTGITYDRESIERWLFSDDNVTLCPVTNLVLPRDTDTLTPNHTLRRLIQAWCTANASAGVDRIPTPKIPLSKALSIRLVRDLTDPKNRLHTLRKLEGLAMERESNRKSMVEAGVVRELLNCIVACHENGDLVGIEETLRVFYLIRGYLLSCDVTDDDNTRFVMDQNENLLDSIFWVLDQENVTLVTRSHALWAMHMVIGKANSGTLERLLTDQVITKIVHFLKQNYNSDSDNDNSNVVIQRTVLHIMLDICPWGKNRALMVESGAVFWLIQLELDLSPPDKKITELALGVLFHLCCSADGRAQLLSHAAGIAMVTRRLLKVSPAADDRALLILSLISRFSATSGVLQEMLRVGTVAKLCMVLQADCASYLKDKAKEILRTHFDFWKNSPCVEVATLTRYAR